VRGQMYIIRVVKQVNRGQGIKGNSSPLAPQVPLNAQQPKASTPKVIVAHFPSPCSAVLISLFSLSGSI